MRQKQKKVKHTKQKSEVIVSFLYKKFNLFLNNKSNVEAYVSDQPVFLGEGSIIAFEICLHDKKTGKCSLPMYVPFGDAVREFYEK